MGSRSVSKAIVDHVVREIRIDVQDRQRWIVLRKTFKHPFHPRPTRAKPANFPLAQRLSLINLGQGSRSADPMMIANRLACARTWLLAYVLTSYSFTLFHSGAVVARTSHSLYFLFVPVHIPQHARAST